MFDRVWLNAHLATMDGPPEAPLGLIEDGAVAMQDGLIAYAGPRAGLPGPATESTDCDGAWILPGLIDCHTHLVFGGNRASEFEQRLEGASYEEIARAGGGIFSTVRTTRAASEAELQEAATPRLQGLMDEGVTTVEIKSGYGLDLASEMKMLRVARRLGAAHPVEIVTSLLAAHAVPPDFAGGAKAYTEFVVREVIPAAAASGLADAVDAFCERIAFSPAQTARVFGAARAQGLPVRLPAVQIAELGVAAVAARFGALSADHLEYANPEGLRAMAEAGSVAVLLPGATYFIREERLPDIAAMRAAGLRMALSTDLNPGSSPARSLLLMLNFGCTLYRLTVAEALLGVTRHAAAALGLADRGVLRPGQRADLALYRIAHPAELCYWIGGNPCIGRVLGGV